MGAVDYVWGQCTWFVSHALTWLGVNQVGALGNASDWLVNAERKGLPVSSVPVKGAAVVYNANYPGSQGDGHVGVVTAVNPNGTFQVASDNWGAPGVTHVGTSTMADVEGFILPPNPTVGASAADQAKAYALQTTHVAPSGASVASASYQTGSSDGGSQPGNWNFANWNPFDPNSFLNIGGDINGVGQGLTSGVSTVFETMVGWVERGFIIVFGVTILLIGIFVLFQRGSGTVKTIVGQSATPDSVTEGPTSTEVTERSSPSGEVYSRKTVTRTSSRKVKGKSGSGIKGAFGGGVKGDAAEAAMA